MGISVEQYESRPETTGFRKFQRRLHFGVGPSTSVDRIEIHWPSGRVQTINSPRLNTIHKIVEPA